MIGWARNPGPPTREVSAIHLCAGGCTRRACTASQEGYGTHCCKTCALKKGHSAECDHSHEYLQTLRVEDLTPGDLITVFQNRQKVEPVASQAMVANFNYIHAKVIRALGDGFYELRPIYHNGRPYTGTDNIIAVTSEPLGLVYARPA